MKNARMLRLSIVSIAACLIGLSAYVALVWHQAKATPLNYSYCPDPDSIPPVATVKREVVTLSATELYDSVQKYPDLTVENYYGKLIEVSGLLIYAGKGRVGIPFLMIYSGPDQYVLAELFFANIGQLNKARKDKIVTVRGQFSGKASNVVILENCKLIN